MKPRARRRANPQPQGNSRHASETARDRRPAPTEEDPPEARYRQLLPRLRPTARGRTPPEGGRAARRVLARPAHVAIGHAKPYAEGEVAAVDHTNHYDAAIKAFDRAGEVGLPRPAGAASTPACLRLPGHLGEAKTILTKLKDAARAQRGVLLPGGRPGRGRGRRAAGRPLLRAAPSNSSRDTPGALFRLGFLNDLQGNDDDAIGYYERCLKYPPVGKGVLYNLGVLYEDNDMYDKAADCYRRLAKADPTRRTGEAVRARTPKPRLSMHYSPEDEQQNVEFRKVMEIPITDFELSCAAATA